MNTIEFDKFPSGPKEEEDDFFLIKDFREKDLNKIIPILNDMYSKIKKIDDEFNYSISSTSTSSAYLGDGATHYEKIVIDQSHTEFSNKLQVLIPKLMHKNFFILNGSTYVPLLFLEKAPLDRIFNTDEKKDKIIINVNAVFNFTFDFQKKVVQFKMKQIPMDIFFRVVFENDKDYLENLLEIGFITKLTYTKDERRRFIKSFLDFYKWNFFTDICISEWVDEFLLLDYFRGLFHDFYGISTFQDIVKLVIDHELNETVIDMAKISNRRVIMTEYLIKPLFEVYARLLWNIVDKKSQNILPSINEFSVITTGFNGLLHRGQLYDISNPFALPLINKVSQDIQIIKQGRLPKSWQRNDETGFGRLCPITVSPQNMGSNLVFTSPSKINKYGRIALYEHNK